MDIEKLLRHRPFVRALARRLVRDEARADDLVQETYLTALRSPPKHDGPLRAWLAAVVRNLARTRNRAEWRRARHERKPQREGGRAEPRDLPSAEETLEKATWHQRLVEATMALEEPYRSTLLLRYFEELDSSEIASIQGVPAATVRTRIRRGIERLRSELDQTTPGGRATWAPALLLLAGAPGGVAATAAGSAHAAPGVSIPLTAAAVGSAVVVVLLAIWSVVPGPDDSGSGRVAEARATRTSAGSRAIDPKRDAPVYVPAPRPGHQLQVQVLDQGRPADGATIVLSRTPEHAWSVVPRGAWQPVDRGVTDRYGSANFGGLGTGYVRVAAWRSGRARALAYVWLPQKLAHAVVLELGPEQRPTIRVISAESGEPIPGARIWLEEQGGGPREPGPDRALVDRNGVAELGGMDADDAETRLTVTAAGYRTAHARVPVDDVVLEPTRRFVRWRVAPELRHGGVEVVRPNGGEPAPARWVEGALEVGPIPEAGWPMHWVFLDDGRSARIEAERGLTRGPPLQFAEPVGLTVNLRDTKGRPIEGVRLALADAATGTHLFERRESWTDDAGRSVLSVYSPDPVLVLYRDLTGTRWRALRTFDPTGGDARAELRLPRARTLRLRIDGADARVREGGWALLVGRERVFPVRWQDGSWTVRLRRWTPEGRTTVHFLAKGFEPVSRTFERGEAETELRWMVELQRASLLAVHVRRARADQSFQLVLAGLSPRRGPSRYSIEVGPDGVARDATIPAGEHRLLDLVSGKTSFPFLASAGGSVDVLFDLSDVAPRRPVLAGRLMAPAGFPFDGVRLEARPGGGVPIARDGTFRVDWPEQGGVELLVEGGGIAQRRTFVTNPTEDLRIPFAPIASGVYHLDGPPIAAGGSATKRRVVAIGPDGRAVAVNAVVEGRLLRFTGLEPGTWDLMVDLPGRAPATRTGVTLTEGGNDFGPLALSAGTTLRIRVEPGRGSLPPELVVSAQALDAPRYQRSVRTSGETTFGLAGLGAGSFRLTAWDRHTGLRVWSAVVECDGVGDRDITIPRD